MVWFVLPESAEWASSSWRSTSSFRMEVREIRRGVYHRSDFHYEILSVNIGICIW